MTTFVGYRQVEGLRAGGAVNVPKGPGMMVRVLRGILMDVRVSEQLLVSGVSAPGCKCRAHVPIDCGAEEVENEDGFVMGCKAGKVGSAGFVKSMQRAGQDRWKEDVVHEACLADEPTRAVDARFAQLVSETAFVKRGLMNRLAKGVLKKYATGLHRDMSCFEAGYCHLLPCDPGIRTRVVRVLGPGPLMVLAAAVVSMVGVQKGQAVTMVRTGSDMWHVVETSEGVGDVALDFVQKVGSLIVQHGAYIRVGGFFAKEVPPIVLTKEAVSESEREGSKKAGKSLEEWARLTDAVPLVGPEVDVAFRRIKDDDDGLIDYDKLAEAILRRREGKQKEKKIALELDTRAILPVESYYQGNDEFTLFLAKVEKLCGHKVPKSGHWDLAMARFTAATMPDVFINGRDRLKTLATVGDAALLLGYISVAYRSGQNMQSLQVVRTTVLTNSQMSHVMAKSTLASSLVMASGVVLASSTGATAYEAVAGVLHLYCAKGAVENYASNTGLLVSEGDN